VAASGKASELKVLFHLLDAGVGGGQLVATRVAAALVERGDEIGLVVPADGPAAERFRNLGATVSHLDAGTLQRPLMARSLARVLEPYDLLYSHTATPGTILGAAATHYARRPHMVHQHTFPYFSPTKPVGAIQRALMRHVATRSGFIAVAEHVRVGLESVGIAHDRIQVVPNGVPAAAVPASTPEGPVSVGVLARLDPGKNVHVFIAAATRLLPTASIRFVIGGVSSPFTDYERELRRQAAEAGIEVVQSEDGEAFLRGLDIAVVPSSYEGSPLVLLEAMALGRAVIASDIPGIREALAPESAGVLVPAGDASALAVAIQALVEDPVRRVECGARAREVASRRFSLAATLERTLVILDRQAAT
jgi:glycosyltransferase involved in cell wall biosynthesis